MTIRQMAAIKNNPIVFITSGLSAPLEILILLLEMGSFARSRDSRFDVASYSHARGTDEAEATEEAEETAAAAKESLHDSSTGSAISIGSAIPVRAAAVE
eukprot:CAMPEP_0170631550 /NCGR_PEP_ID=MMETSP0224-20130122/34712_1 /TAXON_ID=285029 /ORGANISM="Togula jolla, Strain CCCM 725" /LENGTH=99 /DNA_ID=CAMNT_0010959919 /DNA_START=431 /DNA_END=727 /DNA_ORIENTATION=+